MSDTPRGRRPKLTPEVHLGIVHAVLNGNYGIVAAGTMRIRPKTYYRWMQLGRKFPEGIYGAFRADVLEAQRQCESQLVEVVRIGSQLDPKLALELLRSRYPHRWGRDVSKFRDIDEAIEQIEGMVNELSSTATTAEA